MCPVFSCFRAVPETLLPTPVPSTSGQHAEVTPGDTTLPFTIAQPPFCYSQTIEGVPEDAAETGMVSITAHAPRNNERDTNWSIQGASVITSSQLGRVSLYEQYMLEFDTRLHISKPSSTWDQVYQVWLHWQQAHDTFWFFFWVYVLDRIHSVHDASINIGLNIDNNETNCKFDVPLKT